ncbi:MAG TPA: protein-disulfide reductase DsbD domain-containing protein [Verrucomicrobiae bacterium]|jgi:Disulphide bond corrector protein DsbC|nr:protein-disulfide reductase DsbD domain-containing protein [Verrucomicrobiae bacterium]
MKRVMGVTFVLAIFAVLLGVGAVRGQNVSAKDVVAPTAYASYDPVGRGMPLQVAVVLKIRPGFHVNAHAVTEEYLIPTEIRADVPAGFKAGSVIYPKGTLESFAFAKDKKLNVYTDAVTVKLPLTVLPDAPLGAQHLAIKLKYQACSQEICLPPVTKDVEATINVVAGQAGAKSANASVFAK